MSPTRPRRNSGSKKYRDKSQQDTGKKCIFAAVFRSRRDGGANGELAQLVEHLVRNQGVVGSNPIFSTQKSWMLKFQHPVFFKADGLRNKGGHGATALRGFRRPATLEFDNSRLSSSRDVAFLLKQLNTPKHKVSEKKVLLRGRDWFCAPSFRLSLKYWIPTI